MQIIRGEALDKHNQQSVENADYWRDRASEARAMAGAVANPENKRLMLGIAEGYEKLAQRVEARRKS